MKHFAVGIVIGLVLSTSVLASPTGSSIGFNFAVDEPNGGFEAEVAGAAGAVGTVNWNNLEGQADIFDEVVMDVSGAAQDTGIEIEWISNNTWSSDGRSEANNDAPEGNDRALMLGYLDTSATSITEVNIENLPPSISGGFDVYLYTHGGVNGRGGTFTLTADGPSVSQENVNTAAFDGTFIEGAEGNYLFFEGLSGNALAIEAQATTEDLFRAPLNAIEICATGACLPLPTPVAGRGVIGSQALPASVENPVLGPGGDSKSGLAQEWVNQGNPGNKAGIDSIFGSAELLVPAFQAGHGSTWWTGSDAELGELVKYPDEVQPPFNNDNNDNYVVRATGEILIPESGTYRFTDGVDDFTYLAIDIDKSGVAGDSADEVLIEDNSWTNTLRDGNNGGGGLGEADFDVAAGGEWLAIEFNMGEGGGGDSGVIYWDYDPNAPAGQRLAGAEGFPEFVEDALFPEDAENMYIPDTHLRSDIRPLVSADLVGSVTSPPRGFEFEVDGDTDEADKFVITNRDADVYTTVLDVDGIPFLMNGTGDLQPGDSFVIVDVDQIQGMPVVTSLDPDQVWTFNPATGEITFGAGVAGDYNNNGALDIGDLDLQAQAIKDQDLSFDENNDGVVDSADRRYWVNELKNTWMGDADLNGEFNSSDFVAVFTAGKYESGETASWSEGDWDGDMDFDSTDFVSAFSDGGYEMGQRDGGPNAATAAVPEPSSIALLLLGAMCLLRLRRR